MAKHWPITLGMILSAIPVLATFGFLMLAAFSGGSAGGTLATGRSVMTYTDSAFLSSEFRGDTAIIRTDGKTIVIHPTALVVNDVSVAIIDEETSDVEIHVEDGMVSFLADGNEISTPIR